MPMFACGRLTMMWTRPGTRWRLALAAVGLGLISACGRHEPPADSQIVAQVNESEISIHQVQTLMQIQPALADQWGREASFKVLDSLIEQELAAQAARQMGLDTSPKVLQAMELAKREVLARAYQDQLAEKGMQPDSVEIDQYYDRYPELFAERKQYTIQESLIALRGPEAFALKAKIEGASDLAEVNALLATAGVGYSSRNTVQWAESIPLDLLRPLSKLREGQSMAVVRPNGLLIVTVVHTESAPQTRSQAGGAIKAVLTNFRRKEAVARGMKALQAQAKIKRFGAFVQPAASDAVAPAPK